MGAAKDHSTGRGRRKPEGREGKEKERAEPKDKSYYHYCGPSDPFGTLQELRSLTECHDYDQGGWRDPKRAKGWRDRQSASLEYNG